MFGIVRVDCSYLLHAAVTANRSKCKRPNSETFKHCWQQKADRGDQRTRKTSRVSQSCAKLCRVSPTKFHLWWRSPGFGESSGRRKSSREVARRWGGSAERKALCSWGMVMLSILLRRFVRASKDISIDAFDALKVVQHRIIYALHGWVFNVWTWCWQQLSTR